MSTVHARGQLLSAVAAVRAELWDAGFRPIPIHNHNAPGPSPGKRPWGATWQLSARRDPPVAVTDPARLEASNTGILCDGLRPIDIDVEDARAVAHIRALAIAMFGEAPTRFRDNSKRCLMLFRAAEGEPAKCSIAGDLGKVEILGFGGQFVALGVHPSGAELRWTESPTEVARDTLPAVSEAQITEFLAACAPIIGAKPPEPEPERDRTSTSEPQADPVRLAAALAAVPNDGPADWDKWTRTGLATWAATAGSSAGFAAFDAWSARHPAYDAKATRARWNSFRTSPPNRIGAGTVFHLARETGYTPPAKQIGTNLPAYYPPITEPREDALRLQNGTIATAIAEGATVGWARRMLAQMRAAELLDQPNATPAEKAAITRRLHGVVADRFNFPGRRIPRPQRIAVTGAQGSGKTTVSLRSIARIEDPIIVHKLAPTLEKAEEDLRQYRGLATERSMPAMVVRGRAAADPMREGEAMCPRHEVVTEVAQAGFSPRKLICPGCKLNETCGALRQERTIKALTEPALFVMAKDYLHLPCPAPEADLVICDERETIEAVARTEIPLDALASDLVPFTGGDPGPAMNARNTMDRVRRALSEPNALAALREADVDRVRLRELRRAIDITPVLSVDGGMADAEIAAAVKAADDKTRRKVLAMLAVVERDIDKPRDTLTGAAFDPRKRLVMASVLRRPRGVKNASVLVLDGSGDIALNRKLFGAGMQHVEARIERDATVTGTTGKRYSRQSITGCDRDGTEMPSRTTGAKRLREEIAMIAARKPGTLLVTTKGAEQALLAGGHLGESIATAHLSNLRGKNQWEDRNMVVEVGQETMSIEQVEMIARAFMADDDAPFVSMVPKPGEVWTYMAEQPDGSLVETPWPWKQWPYRCTRMRRMRDGSLQPVEVEVHPDPRVQRVLEQVREAEVIQAIDRVRPVFNRREIVAMNELALDLTYDQVVSHRDLVSGGSRIARAWERAGVLPETPEELCAAFPDLFGSVSTARRAIRDLRQKCAQTPNKNPICGSTLFFYRRPGQRGRLARVRVADHPDPKAAAEAVLGPLSYFGRAKAEPEPSADTVLSPPIVVVPVGGRRPASLYPAMPGAPIPRHDLPGWRVAPPDG